MIYVSCENLKPGMILAKDIWCRSSFLPLLCAGNKLSDRIIQNFNEKEIRGAYIECPGSEGIEIEEIIPMEVKVRVSAEIEQIFKCMQNEKGSIFTCMDTLNRVADYLVDIITENDDCMLNIIDLKNYNEYAYVHSMQVGILSTLIGRKMAYSSSKLKDLAISGILHDIGKTFVPTAILDKEGPLTSDEYSIMQKHPKFGIDKLMSCGSISGDVLEGIINHHEKVDGTGYPYHLVEDEISEFGKIIAIADVYDALTSTRTYRDAWEPHAAINYMMSCTDSHFNVDLLSKFLTVVAAYPVGVLVKLNNGLVGVVTNTVEGLPLNPIVKVLSPGKERGTILDLARDPKCFTIQVVDTIKNPVEFLESLNQTMVC
ncbi:HD-GYP domain-containing protein [Paludicola sp. MB14-C6]|uniref:HD-GYP domain-containing protein n=1 Tax=Paludihabitans sp. MB14-C6 TaxID=3070656 RepID=UPI0027DC4159|nr:HD-GYP domain-containing protein [Paludicola sp. MB14-C6]WMJ21989.1 HD-GYP domain-containing protein [Paludicola sp. MB14-C6]